MKTMRIGCPKCGVRLGVTREMQGRTLRCTSCQQHLRFGMRPSLNAPPQAALTQSSHTTLAQAPRKQQGNGSTRATKPSPLAAPVLAAVSMPRISSAEPIDLSVPRLSAFSGRVWGGFAATVLLLGGAVAGSLFFAP